MEEYKKLKKQKSRRSNKGDDPSCTKQVVVIILYILIGVISVTSLSLSIYNTVEVKNVKGAINEHMASGAKKSNVVSGPSFKQAYNGSFDTVIGFGTPNVPKKPINITEIINSHIKINGDTYFMSAKMLNHPSGYDMYVHILREHDVTADNSNRKRSWEEAANGNCVPDFVKGVKIKQPMPWMFDESTVIPSSLPFIYSVLQDARNSWQQYTTETLYGGKTTWTGDGVDNDEPDGKNEIEFGDTGEASVLAYTNIFGFFDSYPESQRKIAEYDIRFSNQVPWCDATNTPTCYHFPRVAAHEYGHTLWLADVYNTGGKHCDDDVLMFGVTPMAIVNPDQPMPQDLYVFLQLYNPSDIVRMPASFYALVDNASFALSANVYAIMFAIFMVLILL